MECGARLQRSPAELALAPPFALEESNRLPAPTSHPMFDPATGQLLAVPPPPRVPPPDEDATNVLPAVGAPLGRGGFGPPDLSARGPGRWDHPPEHRVRSGPTRPMLSERRPTPTVQPPYRNEYEGGYHDATGRVPATYAPWEAAAWEQDEAASAAPTFRLKPLLVLAVVTAAAAIVGMFLAILDLDVPGNPELDGPWKLNDFGTNLTVAGMLTVLTMVLGALAWCVGFRWGAGLAGGAGAGLAGWAALGSRPGRGLRPQRCQPARRRLRRHPRRRLLGGRRRRGPRARGARGLARTHGRRRSCRPRPVGRGARGDGHDHRRGRPADPPRRRRRRPQLVERAGNRRADGVVRRPLRPTRPVAAVRRLRIPARASLRPRAGHRRHDLRRLAGADGGHRADGVSCRPRRRQPGLPTSSRTRDIVGVGLCLRRPRPTEALHRRRSSASA